MNHDFTSVSPSQAFLPAPTHIGAAASSEIPLLISPKMGVQNPPPSSPYLGCSVCSLPHCKSLLHSSSFRGISFLACEQRMRGSPRAFPSSGLSLSSLSSVRQGQRRDRSGIGAADGVGCIPGSLDLPADSGVETVGPDRRWAVAD